MIDKWINMASVNARETEEDAGYAVAHGRLVERLIEMARASPEMVDPDVQIALGVLFNASEVSLEPPSCRVVLRLCRNTSKRRIASQPPYLSDQM